jgi:hypothetical protein
MVPSDAPTPFIFVFMVGFLISYAMIQYATEKDSNRLSKFTDFYAFSFFSNELLVPFFIEFYKKRKYWYETKTYLFFIAIGIVLGMVRAYFVNLDIVNNIYFISLLLFLPFLFLRSLVFLFRNFLIIRMLFELLKNADLKNQIIEYMVMRNTFAIEVLKSTQEAIANLPATTSRANMRLLEEIREGAKLRILFFDKKLDFIICNLDKFIKINLIFKFIYLGIMLSLQGFTI